MHPNQYHLPGPFGWPGLLLLAAVLASGPASPAAQAPNFDRLTETDRQTFSRRFEKEIWPLLVRHGKDGCVGCHQPDHSSSLRLQGKPDADFRTLLREGFLLPEDPGSILHVVSTTNKKQRMPPGPRPAWTPAEVQQLRAFVTDLDGKQRK